MILILERGSFRLSRSLLELNHLIDLLDLLGLPRRHVSHFIGSFAAITRQGHAVQGSVDLP